MDTEEKVDESPPTVDESPPTVDEYMGVWVKVVSDGHPMRTRVVLVDAEGQEVGEQVRGVRRVTWDIDADGSGARCWLEIGMVQVVVSGLVVDVKRVVVESSVGSVGGTGSVGGVDEVTAQAENLATARAMTLVQAEAAAVHTEGAHA